MREVNELKLLIKSIKDAPVLVIGDIMLDKFIYGNVDRISPESPVPVLSIKREDEMLGGAGNALANLVGLTAKPNIISVIGDDKAGETIKSQLNVLGVENTHLVSEENRPTTLKTRYLAGHQQLLRTDFEHKTPVLDATSNAILKHAKALIPTVKSVIISDYGKGMLSSELLANIISAANEANVPVIVDPKGQDFSIYKGATAITPNKKELSDATKGRAVSADSEILDAANELIETCGIQAVIATRSKDGMSVIEKGQDPLHLRSSDIEVYDVSGAGDSVIATIASTIAAGGSLKDAASLANIAGSIVVTKVGTAPIRIAELEEALDGDLGDVLIKHYAKSKTLLRQADCLGWDEAAERVKRWKAQGLKVGFTNGCFDILHSGHVRYLAQARDMCDRLVLGLNSDSSVRVLKGPTRPIHDEESRADVLGALSSVDLVVLFGAKEDGDDNTAIDLLKTIKPDFYVKGGDYTVDQIPEAPTVMAYGGEVKIMSVFEGHSTTNSVARMNAEEAAE